MKYCSNCGKEIPENSIGCPYCSNSNNVEQQNGAQQNVAQQNVAQQNGAQQNVAQQNVAQQNFTQKPILSERNIAVAIILSIVTCGIYGIYWFVVMTNESNSVSDEKTASGGLALLFFLLTCGLYAIYWNYKMGKKLYTAGKKYNLSISDNSVLYLVFSLFGLGIVSYCMIQSDLNKFAK